MTKTLARVLDGELILSTATVDTPEGLFHGGACSFTEEDASVRASSEAAERHTLLVEGPRHVVPTARVSAAGKALEQIIEATTPAEEWVPARRMRSGDPVWLPADLVLLRWRGSRELPVQQTSVGSAAHPDRARAVESGARECLERYAVRRVWSGTTRLADVTDHLRSAVPASLSRALDRHGLRAHAWLVGATLPAAVVVVMVSSSRNRATFGSSCAPTLEDGLRHALCEAISVRAAFADANGLKDNFTMADERVDYALRASSFQDAFLAFLRRLECTTDPGEGRGREIDIVAYLENEFHAAPVVFDLGRSGELHVVKVVVPSPQFFLPRRHCGHVLAPGYLE